MLRAILNKSWRQHPTRNQLYGHMSPITKTIQVRRTRHAGHCWRSRDELISDVLLRTLHIAGQKQDDHLVLTFSSDVRIRDVALKTYKRRWTIRRSGKRGSGISVLVAWHDDDDMCFNQTGDISTLNGSSLKLVDRSTYQGNSVSSTETDIDTRLTKVWTASNSYRSYGNQTWPTKWNPVSFKQRSCWYCYRDALHGRRLNGWRKRFTATTQECCEQYWRGPGGNTQQSSSSTATSNPSRKLSKLDEPDTQETAGYVGMSS